MPTNDELLARIEQIDQKHEERYMKLENAVEELFYSLVAQRLRKPILEEIVAIAVLEYFNVARKDFIEKNFVKIGRPYNPKGVEKNISLARNWFMVLLRYVMQKHPGSIRSSYPFYHVRKEHKFRPNFTAAMQPMTDRDFEQRKILFGISAIVKRICAEEGVLSENFSEL